MADIAASVLAKLKNKAKAPASVIISACSFSFKKNFCDDWQALSMRIISC